MKQKGERILSMILTVALLILSFPITVQAEGNAHKDGTIASFVPLEDRIKVQNVVQGTKQEDLILPDTLEAYIYEVQEKEQANQENSTVKTVLDVSWKADPEYDPAKSEEYKFTPVIDQAFLTKEVELPVITVKVMEGEPQKVSDTVTTEDTTLVSNVALDTIKPEVSKPFIYANGLPLIITGTSDTSTTIYVDYNANGIVDADDKSLHSIDPSFPKDGSDLSVYSIYGGGNSKTVAGDTSITMIGGKVSNIWGGSSNSTVNNTNIVMRGGAVTNLYGTGTSDVVHGSTHITVEKGAYISTLILGGGNSSTVEGDTNIMLTHVNYWGSLYGGGSIQNSSVQGSTNIRILNSTVDYVYGGGHSDGSVNNTNVILQDSKANRIYGGGVGSGTVNNTNVEIYHSKISDAVYGGSNGGYANDTSIIMKESNVGKEDNIGGIYGGTNNGNVKNTYIDIRGGEVTGHIYGGNNGFNNNIDTLGTTTIKIVDATVTGNVFGNNGNLTIGGSAVIGELWKNLIPRGIQMNDNTFKSGVDNFRIEPELTGSKESVFVVLPKDYGDEGMIAPNGVESDVAKIKLVGYGIVPKDVKAYFDDYTEEIKVGIVRNLTMTDFQRMDTTAQFTLVSDVDGELFYGITAPNEKMPSISAMTSLGNIKAGQTIDKEIQNLTNKAQKLWIIVKDKMGYLGKVRLEIPAITYALRIENGTGTGSYEEGDQVSITANPAPEYAVFDHWEGGEDAIFKNGSRTEATTTITMPKDAVTLQAIYTHVHQFDKEWKSDKTSHWHECLAGDHEIIDKENHHFGKWIIDQEPTLKKEGSQYRECEICGYAERQSIPKLVASYSQQTITDPVSGIQVNGDFSEDAILEIVTGEAVLHANGTCSVCEELRKQQEHFLSLYDIHLKAGSYQGEVEVNIHVGEAYNGKSMVLLRCDGQTLERQELIVENGIIKGRFSSLSPYAVRMLEEKPVEEPIEKPTEEPIKDTASTQTENTTMLMWILMAGSMMCLGTWRMHKKNVNSIN